MKASGYGILIGVLLCVVLLAAAALAVFGADQTTTERRVFEPVRAGSQPVSEEIAVKSPDGYVLRSYGYGLGLFYEGEAVPFDCVEAELSCLPELDRQALAEGIHVSSEAELRALVEDFSS